MAVGKSFLVILAVFFILSTSGCGGKSGSAVSSSSAGKNSVAVAVQPLAITGTCPNGGIQVDTGIDTNGNGVLDVVEVTATQYVCNGNDGSSGMNSLVAISAETAGSNCADGGNKIEAGVDSNGNGVLDASEVSTTNYICNGASGANGGNGLNSLVSVVPESAGLFCANGGNKVNYGLDSNGNGVLDAGEVSSSYYVCDGAPGGAGTGVAWQDVTAGSVQAVSNTGYMANNPTSQVVITLPVAPTYGDLVEVTGVGAGGWKIAQNPGQSIITENVVNYLDTWVRRNSVGNLTSFAVSFDGSELVAAGSGSQLGISTDYGLTWTARESARAWRAVASSADGSKLVAVVYGGQIYISTDSGVTWTAHESARNWNAVASSADGVHLVATVDGGQIYTSADSGITWTARESARKWVAVSSSADGSKLIAAESDYSTLATGQLYVSTDFGTTWNTGGSPLQIWSAVASSASGDQLVALGLNSQVLISTDLGTNWTAHELSRTWVALASSADGRVLAAVAVGSGGNQIYISTDFGITWTAHGSLGSWNSLALSGDGSKIYVGEPLGSIYASLNSTLPGPSGSIRGDQYDAVDLQYIGNDTFVVRGFAGDLVVQ